MHNLRLFAAPNMKKKSEKKSSRRDLLKNIAVATVGASIAGCQSTAQGKVQSAKAAVATRTLRPNAETKKLGELARHKLHPNSAFKKTPWRRIPGWRADTADKNGNEEFYFPEEALRSEIKGSEKFDPFPPPTTGAAFAEPTTKYNPSNPQNAREWNQHNAWILGHPFDENSTDKFDQFLAQIARRVREYNAALYWLRRLHFRENAEPISSPPRENPNGDESAHIETPGTLAFDAQVERAEKRWIDAVRNLNAILDDQPVPGFRNTRADMVEVNGYIISMRVISNYDDGSGTKDTLADAFQIGGSSSSHAYISSPFCSKC